MSSESLQHLADAVANELASEQAALTALDNAEAISPLPDSDQVRAFLPDKGITIGLHRLLARAVAAEGDDKQEERILFALAERLNQAGYWRALARVAASLLEVNPQRAAPLVVRARIQGGTGAVTDDLLEAAHGSFPRHGMLAWKTAEARLARGDAAGGLEAACLALPELVEDKNYEAADDVLLLLAEDTSPASVRTLCRTLELLSRQEAWDRFDTALDLAQAAFTSERGAPIAWPVVRDLWLKHPERESLRGVVAAVARATLARYPDPEALIRASQVNRPSQPASVVLERLRRAVRFPCGYYVLHATWGVGLIRENDIEAIVVDFPEKPMHRISMATAERALEAVPPGDLRVLLATDPKRVQELVRTEPATVVALALATLPQARGTAEDLRRVLVPAVLPATAWAGWWKTARASVVSDPRIDSRRAYENRFRLPSPEDDEAEKVPLPQWNVKTDVIKNLTHLDMFFAQHPSEDRRLLEAFRERVETAFADPALAKEERVACGLWLLRLDSSATVQPEALVDSSLDFNRLPKVDQEMLLARLDRSSVPAESRREAWIAALGSRLAGIRRAAWAKLAAAGSLQEGLRRVLAQAQTRPEGTLQVLEEGLDQGEPPAEPEWTERLLAAFLDLLERPPRETHRKRALALLRPDSALGRRLASVPLPEDRRDPFTLRLKRWQGSDRVRFPLLDFLREVNHGPLAEVVEGHRARSAARLAGRMGSDESDPFDGQLVVTAATRDRLEAERHRVGMELKTTIPKAIQKARELGDLRENAEYKAAKDKQAQFARRFEELDSMVKRICLIEDLDRVPGVAFPGTRVRLRPADGQGPEISYWLLGEGDQALGGDVVSYKAPVGQALLGRRVGEEVRLPGTDGEHVYRIAEVEERLP